MIGIEPTIFDLFGDVAQWAPKHSSDKKECACNHGDRECSSDRRNCVRDISKVFWVDKKLDDEGNITTVFHVIAPFANKPSIKATITKIENDSWLILTYENDDSIFRDCMSCNFRVNKAVEYKYNLNKYDVDKSKMKLSYDRGVISLFTVASKPSKNDDFSIGL